MRFFIGLGSNIEPGRNFPLMLRALLRVAPAVHISRVVQTEPVGVAGARFLNAAAAFEAAMTQAELKAYFNAVEAALGRDRADPASKSSSRTADLDILFALEATTTRVPAELLPSEPYVRPLLLELLAALGLTATAEPLALAPGVALQFDELAFGKAPCTFTSTGDRVTTCATLHPSSFTLHS